MVYLAAIAFLFNRMNLKHQEKNESFRTEPHEYLNGLIAEEYQEWIDCLSHEDCTIKDELNELADVAVTCLLKIEVLLGEVAGPCEDPSPY